jgi:group I intron endonuclease
MGYVYKFTHIESGKWYIGSHNGSNSNYTGSGTLWGRVKKKYGIKSFVKTILYEGINYRQEEQRILTELDAVNNPMSYNLKNEALGGTFPGELNGMYGKTHTKETKYNCGSGFRGKSRPDHSEKMKGVNNPMYGKTDHTKGIVEYTKNRTGKTNNEIYGKDTADIISKKISETHKGKPKPAVSAAQSGGGNSSAKRIIVDGIEYTCIKEAMKKLNLSRYKILSMGVLVDHKDVK